VAEPVRKNLRHQCFSIENLSSICLYVWKALTLMCFQTIIKRTVIPKKNTPPILFNGEILARIVFFRKAILIYIIISVFCVCVCVWHSIGSAPGRDTNLRPVSLEPLGLEPAIFEKKFPEKWTVAKSRGKSLRFQCFSIVKI
jgi:hypothetical protein